MKIILSFLSLFVASVAFAQDVKTQQDSIASAKKSKRTKRSNRFWQQKAISKSGIRQDDC